MIEVFAEYGAIGVVIFLFAGQILFLQKTLMGKLKETDDKVIALINRWNKADDRQDRRHEKILEEMNDVTDQINCLKGRINGSGGRG